MGIAGGSCARAAGKAQTIANKMAVGIMFHMHANIRSQVRGLIGLALGFMLHMPTNIRNMPPGPNPRAGRPLRAAFPPAREQKRAVAQASLASRAASGPKATQLPGSAGGFRRRISPAVCPGGFSRQLPHWISSVDFTN